MIHLKRWHNIIGTWIDWCHDGNIWSTRERSNCLVLNEVYYQWSVAVAGNELRMLRFDTFYDSISRKNMSMKYQWVSGKFCTKHQLFWLNLSKYTLDKRGHFIDVRREMRRCLKVVSSLYRRHTLDTRLKENVYKLPVTYY